MNASPLFEGRNKECFLLEAKKTGRIICFGTGNLFRTALKEDILPYGLDVAYIVANSSKRWGTKFCGYEVFPPDKLLEEKPGEFVVLITNSYIYEVNEQLEAMGIIGAYPRILFQEDYAGIYRVIQLNRPYSMKKRTEGVEAESFGVTKLVDAELFLRQLGEDAKLSEMSSRQLSFLFGMLREGRPEKIVKVGVSAGATTAALLAFLNSPEMADVNSRLYSVDISTSYYQQPEREAGYVAKKWESEHESRVSHEYLLGDVCAAFLDDICADGKKIDFLILDASHVLPGEVLDFLACLPYLSDGATVVMHDVTLSLIPNAGDCIATGVLFSAVTAEKYYMPELDSAENLSNIAAFRVSQDTKRKIRDVFFALGLRWKESLNYTALKKYRNVITGAYNESLLSMFDKIVEREIQCRLEEKKAPFRASPDTLSERWRAADKVFIYGTGYWGTLYYAYACEHGLKVAGMIVSDGREISESGKKSFDVPIFHLSELPVSSRECQVLLAMEGKNYEECHRILQERAYRILNDEV